MNSVPMNPNDPSEDVKLELECEIEEDIEAELEDFVRLNHTGQFIDAHELYEECLSTHDDWYPIAAEYADCLLREGDFAQLAAFSKRAAAIFRDRSERALFQLMHEIGHRSSAARWERLEFLWPAMSFKSPFSSLRDTDIHLLEVILQILVLSGRPPVALDTSLREAPRESQDTPDLTHAGPWSVFIDWFYHLLHHQYFWEAQRILHGLFHVLPRLQCVLMVQACIDTAVTMSNGQESVKIAVSSLVQRFMYVIESGNSNPLAVVPWNDAVTWALFGTKLVEAGGESASLLSCFCLRQPLSEKLDLQISLPLDGADGNDVMPDSLYERLRALSQPSRQPMTAESLDYTDFPGYTEDELNSWALFQAVKRRQEDMLLFLNSTTVNARDGYQRTPLHWASLSGRTTAVQTLFSERNIDVGLVDWFGCTALHYAVKSCHPGGEPDYTRIIEVFLWWDPAQVDIKYPSGVTPLRMAIQRRFYDAARLLLRHHAVVEEGDYEALPQDDESWLSLFSYRPQHRLESSALASSSPPMSSVERSSVERIGLVPGIIANQAPPEAR